LASCGKGEPVSADTAPFEAAIAAYLDSHSMDMQVAEFRSLQVEGDGARAVCKMEEKAGLYGGVGVRWTWRFSRRPGGTWEVIDLER
jgi:hypothetical protein